MLFVVLSKREVQRLHSCVFHIILVLICGTQKQRLQSPPFLCAEREITQFSHAHIAKQSATVNHFYIYPRNDEVLNTELSYFQSVTKNSSYLYYIQSEIINLLLKVGNHLHCSSLFLASYRAACGTNFISFLSESLCKVQTKR